MSIKVTILKTPEKVAEDKKGHTFIHFGGNIKERFQALAIRAGYNRKFNDFGVMLFEQALALAEADFKAQTAPATPEAPVTEPTEPTTAPVDTSDAKE